MTIPAIEEIHKIIKSKAQLLKLLFIEKLIIMVQVSVCSTHKRSSEQTCSCPRSSKNRLRVDETT